MGQKKRDDVNFRDVNFKDELAEVQRKRDKAALATEAEIADIREIMSSKAGRRFIWGLLEDTHIFKTSFTGNSQTFFLEGERNVGIKLITKLHLYCMNQYAIMVEENGGQNGTRRNRTD